MTLFQTLVVALGAVGMMLLALGVSLIRRRPSDAPRTPERARSDPAEEVDELHLQKNRILACLPHGAEVKIREAMRDFMREFSSILEADDSLRRECQRLFRELENEATPLRRQASSDRAAADFVVTALIKLGEFRKSVGTANHDLNAIEKELGHDALKVSAARKALQQRDNN